MRTIRLCSTLMGVILVFGYFTVTAPSTEPQTAKGQKNPAQEKLDLSGEWEQESRVVLGRKMEDRTGIRLRVANGMMTTSVREVWWRPAVVINQEYYRVYDKPMHIDITGWTDWREIDYKGIFRLDNEKLTLCLSRKNKLRPTIFATGTDAGMGEVLLIYKRLSRR